MARVLKVIGLRTVVVAAILIVALLVAWPAAQRGAGEGWTRLTATELRSSRLSERLQRTQERRQAGATLEIRVDELIDEVSSNGRTVLDRESLRVLLQDAVGGDFPIEDMRLVDFLDENPRVRVISEGRSVVLGRWTLTTLARRIVGNTVSVQDMRIGDVLDRLPEVRVSEEDGVELFRKRWLIGLIQAAFANVQRVDQARDPQLLEWRALQQQYAEVVRLAKELRREGFGGEDPNALYDEAYRRLLEANKADYVYLLDGHTRLQEEYRNADVGSMSRVERIAFGWQIRRWAFGEEMAEILFSRQEAMERYQIDSLMIEADDFSSPEAKAKLLRDRRTALKVELAAQGVYVGFPDESQAPGELEPAAGSEFEERR